MNSDPDPKLVEEVQKQLNVSELEARRLLAEGNERAQQIAREGI